MFEYLKFLTRALKEKVRNCMERYIRFPFLRQSPMLFTILFAVDRILPWDMSLESNTREHIWIYASVACCGPWLSKTNVPDTLFALPVLQGSKVSVCCLQSFLCLLAMLKISIYSAQLIALSKKHCTYDSMHNRFAKNRMKFSFSKSIL